MTKRYCFALDLKDDPQLTHEYEKYHEHIPPEVAKFIKESGIIELHIYRIMNRLFMIMDATDNFSLEQNAHNSANNPIMVQWETLMAHYQQVLPCAKANEKWVLMQHIFDLSKQ